MISNLPPANVEPVLDLSARARSSQPILSRVLRLVVLFFSASGLIHAGDSERTPQVTTTRSAPSASVDKQYASLEDALKEPDRVRSLILAHSPRGILPAEIGKLVNLSALILHRNDLTSLPDDITRLSNLRALYLGGSPRLNFKDALAKLARLPRLEGLGLDDNRLQHVPEGIADLANLKRLGLSSNHLTTSARGSAAPFRPANSRSLQQRADTPAEEPRRIPKPQSAVLEGQQAAGGGARPRPQAATDDSSQP